MVGLSAATIYGMTVHQARLPINLNWSSEERLGQMSIHDGSLQFPTGWGTAKADFSWGSYQRLTGQLRFSSVDLRHLFRDSGFSHYTSGQIGGQLNFAGQNIRSFGDITATLNATLHRSQALQLPVLRQLAPFLLGLSTLTVFDQGQLKANLSHGLVRIERLDLHSSVIRLFLEGTITVPEGRLNLGANVNTRAIHLHIGGTFHSPTIQVQPFRLLED
jgi:hypothetical protein